MRREIQFIILVIILFSLTGCSSAVSLDEKSEINTESTQKASSPDATVQTSDEETIEIDVINEYGNTNSNMRNSGYVSKQGVYIFYTNSADGFGLYRMKEDGSGKTKLCDGKVHYINVIGEWIIYTKSEYNQYYGSLYKININGSQETLLVESEVIDVIAYGDYIYYSNNVDFYIYRMSIDGSENTRIGDKYVDLLNVEGDWIFFADTYGIYKMKTDGTEKTTILIDSQLWPGYEVIDDGWIYYVTSNEEGIFRISTDGSKKERVAEETSVPMNINDGWLFSRYDSEEEGGDYLFKVRTDGTGFIVLLDYAWGGDPNICTIDDWIYYVSDGFLHRRMHFDGSDDQTVD